MEWKASHILVKDSVPDVVARVIEYRHKILSGPVTAPEKE